MLSQIQGNSDQSLIKAGGTGMMNEFSWNMIRVQLRKLQLNDLGEDHLRSHFQGRNKLRNSIKLEVWGGRSKTDPERDHCIPVRDVLEPCLCALVVLSSFLSTTDPGAAVLLLVLTTSIRRKRAGKGMDFGRPQSEIPASPGQVHIHLATFPTPNFAAVIQSELQNTKIGNSGTPNRQMNQRAAGRFNNKTKKKNPLEETHLKASILFTLTPIFLPKQQVLAMNIQNHPETDFLIQSPPPHHPVPPHWQQRHKTSSPAIILTISSIDWMAEPFPEKSFFTHLQGGIEKNPLEFLPGLEVQQQGPAQGK
ncbi:uncharacterized protein [Aphelocoma coerulescens]|uniref:uncharacterized protein n=1 Tax=Aphelocoma coerulescens TaxID=39617 RepID=UPI0036049F29